MGALKQDIKQTFSTDEFMIHLWQSLYRDFSASNEQIKADCKQDSACLKARAVPTYRQLARRNYWWANKYYFKCRYQLDSLFKRYRFKQDLYSDEEVINKTYDSFFSTQERISSGFILNERSHRVIRKARQLVEDILGSYDHYEHAESCRFGKRASVGVQSQESYLDVKSSNLTGSQDHIEWFRYHLHWDKLLAQSLVRAPYVATTECCDVLGLTDVPKNHKARRIIMKNTTIGAFYTAGIGKMIQRRLLKVGLNIKTLQKKHRRLVHKFSRTLSHVTADLSSASDSFTVQHLVLLLPDDWYRAIVYGRIPDVKVKGKKRATLESVMTMGVGFTFPLQTLLFYCLLKAIQSLTGTHGLISVYGDDLIYPKDLHRYVRVVFPDLGFVLNEEKTFSHLYFRESCGSDSYCGLDVRPFQPEGEASLLECPTFEMLLYKTINGLLARWSKEDIPSTYHFLMVQLSNVSDEICQVPPSYPESSGIRVDRPSNNYLIPFKAVRKGPRSKRDESIVYTFKVLTEQPHRRYVYNQHIYLWESFRAAGHFVTPESRQQMYLFRVLGEASDLDSKNKVVFTYDSEHDGGRFTVLDSHVLLWCTIPRPRRHKPVSGNVSERSGGVPCAGETALKTAVPQAYERDRRRTHVRSKVTGARLPRLVPFVPSKSGVVRVVRNTAQVFTWL